MQDEFGFDNKGKTREELQDGLRKYGITPKPGYDPKGPNIPDPHAGPNPSTTREKYAAKAAENEEFKDKRTPKSDLIRQAELDKMKEILNMPKGGPKGPSGGGGSGGMGTGKMNRDITKNYKAGGKVKSASARADGCAQRGKTKGRMV